MDLVCCRGKDWCVQGDPNHEWPLRSAEQLSPFSPNSPRLKTHYVMRLREA